MSDVLFVVPVLKEKLTHECTGSLLLASILKENNIDVDIYRYYESEPQKSYDIFLGNSVKNILSKNPKIVSFYCRADIYLTNILVAEKIKELSPETLIVFGGPQADISAKETINQISWVDYCCSGEGETTVYPLFKGLLEGEDVTSVAGLTYRSQTGEVISNPRPELIEDLNTLPFIDYTLLSGELLEELKQNPMPCSMDVGRGCPYNCSYCSTSLFWQRKFRLKSPDRIIAEIKYLNENFSISQFGFEHDLFTANKKRVLEFCKALKESGLEVEWSCSSRADTIDEEVVDAMIDAGMRKIFLGVESGSERIQKIIHKNLNIKKAKHIIRYLATKGVKTTVSLIYGFPEETEEDLNETLQLIYDLFILGSITFPFHLCAIFPGTEYFNKYKDEMVWTDTLSDQTGTLGVKENLDFVHKHQELFSYYREYNNDLRSRFEEMNKTVIPFIEMAHHLNKLDPEKTAGKRLVDLYKDFKDTNKDLLSGITSNKECADRKYELYSNYFHSIYDADTADKLDEILAYKRDLTEIKKEKKDTTDIKTYNVDIKAVNQNKQLKDIAKRTSMVCITMTGNKITCGVQYLD